MKQWKCKIQYLQTFYKLAGRLIGEDFLVSNISFRQWFSCRKMFFFMIYLQGQAESISHSHLIYPLLLTRLTKRNTCIGAQEISNKKWRNRKNCHTGCSCSKDSCEGEKERYGRKTTKVKNERLDLFYLKFKSKCSQTIETLNSYWRSIFTTYK